MWRRAGKARSVEFGDFAERGSKAGASQGALNSRGIGRKREIATQRSRSSASMRIPLDPNLKKARAFLAAK